MLNYIKSELLERLGKLEIKRINNTVNKDVFLFILRY